MKSFLAKISNVKYQALLLLAAAIWGLGTVLIKGIVAEIPPFWLVGARFFSAGLIFCALFLPLLIRLAREDKLIDHIKVSFILGAFMIAGYMANSLGLTDTTAAKSSFLTGLYCVIVPFIAWAIMRRRPSIFNVCAAILCVIGIGFVSLVGQDNLTMGWGDAVTLLSALFLAAQLAATSKLAPGRNMMAITALQFVIGGAMSLGVAAFTEPLPNLEVLGDPSMIVSLIYMVLFATCAALLLQNIGLAKVPAASGSLLLSFESVFGVMFSVMMIGEVLTLPMVFGFALIFVAVIVSEWLPTSSIAQRLALGGGASVSGSGRSFAYEGTNERTRGNASAITRRSEYASTSMHGFEHALEDMRGDFAGSGIDINDSAFTRVRAFELMKDTADKAISRRKLSRRA